MSNVGYVVSVLSRWPNYVHSLLGNLDLPSRNYFYLTSTNNCMYACVCYVAVLRVCVGVFIILYLSVGCDYTTRWPSMYNNRSMYNKPFNWTLTRHSPPYQGFLFFCSTFLRSNFTPILAAAVASGPLQRDRRNRVCRQFSPRSRVQRVICNSLFSRERVEFHVLSAKWNLSQSVQANSSRNNTSVTIRWSISGNPWNASLETARYFSLTKLH